MIDARGASAPIMATEAPPCDPMPEVSDREYLERVIDERDRQYDGRFTAAAVAIAAALAAQEKAVASALLAADRAVTKAETAAEKRFDNVNEFRALVNDQQRTFMPRAEAEVLLTGLSDRIAKVEEAADAVIARGEGRHGATAAITGLLVGASGVAFGVISLLRNWH